MNTEYPRLHTVWTEEELDRLRTLIIRRTPPSELARLFGRPAINCWDEAQRRGFLRGRINEAASKHTLAKREYETSLDYYLERYPPECNPSPSSSAAVPSQDARNAPPTASRTGGPSARSTPSSSGPAQPPSRPHEMNAMRSSGTREAHWTANEIQRLIIERGVDVTWLASTSGVSSKQIYAFLGGKCLLTIENIERILQALGHELEILSDGSPNPATPCPYCGQSVIPIRVHGHEQCPRCTAILERCCDD